MKRLFAAALLLAAGLAPAAGQQIANVVTISATGTTAGFTATLPAVAGKTTYICVAEIDASATAGFVSSGDHHRNYIRHAELPGT
jgi:hypothetical protein